MSVLDFTLNLAALALWLNWWSLRFDPLRSTSATALVGTLRRAEPRLLKGWQLLAGLALLLVLRGVLYWEIGSPADWTPKLDLGLIVLAFRSESFPSVALFSALSFMRVLSVLYFWLLILVLLNRATVEPDPILRLLRVHFGRLARWPWPLLLVLPTLVIAGVWVAVHPLLLGLELVNRSWSSTHLLEQGLLLGLGPFFTLKYLLPVFLLLHLAATYVYLGSSPLWDFIAGTARHLLAPLQWLRLRFGKLDFTPLAGIVLLFLILHWLPNFVLARLAHHGLSLWPE
jgi:uncharacterized protein YggT (Ycf19 family)